MAKSPLKAIKEYCYDCSGYNYAEVEKCPCETCGLYPFRKGKNSFRVKKDLTEEEKKVISDRLGKNRGKKKVDSEIVLTTKD